MTPQCIPTMGEGGNRNPINMCGDMKGRPGKCITMRYADPHYCNGYRYVKVYQPTKQEIEGYPDRSWLTTFGDYLFETVFGVFNSAISAATGGIVTELLGDEVSLETLLNDAVTNGSKQIIQLIAGVEGQITKLVTKSLNKTAAAMGEFVGIAVAAEDIGQAVLNETEYLLEQGEWRAEEAWRLAQKDAADALERERLRVASKASLEAFEAARFSEGVYDILQSDLLTWEDKTRKFMEFTYDAQDLRNDIIFDLAFESGIEVAQSFSDLVAVEMETANELMMETVIKPAATQDALYWALKDANFIEDDEFRQTQLRVALIQAEMASELIKSGQTPLEWIKSQIEVD